MPAPRPQSGICSLRRTGSATCAIMRSLGWYGLLVSSSSQLFGGGEHQEACNACAGDGETPWAAEMPSCTHRPFQLSRSLQASFVPGLDHDCSTHLRPQNSSLQLTAEARRDAAESVAQHVKIFQGAGEVKDRLLRFIYDLSLEQILSPSCPGRHDPCSRR